MVWYLVKPTDNFSFEVFMAVKVQVEVFWVVTQCSVLR
jgi:hypothetical protein